MSSTDLPVLAELEHAVGDLPGLLQQDPAPFRPSRPIGPDTLFEELEERIAHVSQSVLLTMRQNRLETAKMIEVFRDWMVRGAVVRVVGAGRARLAAVIPANRLAHGGARIYVQDDIVPMPHSIMGGGILAASASGKTEAVLDILRKAKDRGTSLTIVGIAAHDAADFKELCDLFIGIHEAKTASRPLQALADVGEYVISELLDGVVVAAGRLAGFDETAWRLGHEDLGSTGPYDLRRPR